MSNDPPKRPGDLGVPGPPRHPASIPDPPVRPPQNQGPAPVSEHRERGIAASERTAEIVRAKGHGVQLEVTVKGGPGGSRIDIAPDPRAGQTLPTTLESKSVDLNAYRKPGGGLDVVKLRAKIREDSSQVLRHEAALREGRKADLPFTERLVYQIENGRAGEAEAFQKVFRGTAGRQGVKGGVLEFKEGDLFTASGKRLTGKRPPGPTPGGVLLLLVDPEFVEEILGAATGTDLEARAKHSDVFHMSHEQREQLRAERAAKAQVDEFEEAVAAVQLERDITEDNARAIVSRDRAADRSEIQDLQRQYPGMPVASSPTFVPAKEEGLLKRTSDRIKSWFFSEPPNRRKKPEKEGKKKPEKEGKDKPEKEGKDKPEKEGKDKPEKEGKDKPEKEGKDKPEKEGKEGTEGKDKPEKEGKDKPEKESKEGKEGKDKAEKESKEGKEGKDKPEKESKEGKEGKDDKEHEKLFEKTYKEYEKGEDFKKWHDTMSDAEPSMTFPTPSQEMPVMGSSPGTRRHFIPPDLRPDLRHGALRNERDR